MPARHTSPVSAAGPWLRELLSPACIARAVIVSGKQSLFSELSGLLCRGHSGLDRQTVLDTLIEREHQGSTGIGEGIALPHGRLTGLPRSIGAFVTLAHALDYDAIDRKPVTMAFALLVPDDAAEDHLRILSRLAGLFRIHDMRQRLLAAQNTEEICESFVQAENRAAC